MIRTLIHRHLARIVNSGSASWGQAVSVYVFVRWPLPGRRVACWAADSYLRRNRSAPYRRYAIRPVGKIGRTAWSGKRATAWHIDYYGLRLTEGEGERRFG
jgi:hypothetical protein